MKLHLNKFGATLTSRQAGREAFAAIQPRLRELGGNELIEVDFEGVVTFSPSWADEVVTKLKEEYNDRVKLQPTDNPSVKATLEILESIHSK